MRGPIAALSWQIWRRNRLMIFMVALIAAGGALFNLLTPESYRATSAMRELTDAFGGVLMAISLILVFGAFNFTESSPERDWTGFPYRLFTLPVPTWLLVLLPMALGIIAVEIVLAAWSGLIFVHGEIERPLWFALVLGAFMACYQSELWCLAGFRFSRMLALGVTGPVFVLIACLPFAKELSPGWFAGPAPALLLGAVALTAYGVAWRVVGRQRCGGGERRNWVKAVADRAIDLLPRRRGEFRTASGAQFWYEWRRSGFLLPLAVGALLVFIIAPMSWAMRHMEGGTVWVLAWTLATPMILAKPLGKGFSKGDFWSRDLALPSFVAIRPLSSGEMTVVKLKVAAFSVALTWALVLAFLSVWLPLWADLDPIGMVRIQFWMAYEHAVWPQYIMAALFIVAAALLTWKYLVSGLCIGLSGRRSWFIGSAAVYCALLLGAFIGVLIMTDHDRELRAWLRQDPNKLLSWLEWLAAACVMAKLWLAARTWRNISARRVRQYLAAWSAATAALVALMLLLWAGGLFTLELMEVLDFHPLDPERLRALMILGALLAVPLARPALAPVALAKNRHG